MTIAERSQRIESLQRAADRAYTRYQFAQIQLPGPDGEHVVSEFKRQWHELEQALVVTSCGV